MKSIKDLDRKILIWISKNIPDKLDSSEAKGINIKGYTSKQIIQRIGKLSNQGYINSLDASAKDYENYKIYGLTIEGERYLADIKHPYLKLIKRASLSLLGIIVVAIITKLIEILIR